MLLKLNYMTVCIIGENLSSLALAKALVKIGLDVDLIENKKSKSRASRNIK